jgi:hypothetical protein
MDHPETGSHHDKPEDSDGNPNLKETLIPQAGSSPEKQTAEAPNNHPGTVNKSPYPIEVRRAVVRLLVAAYQCLKCYWRAPREKSKLSEIIMIVLTCLIAVAAFWSACIFNRQLTAIQETNQIAVDEAMPDIHVHGICLVDEAPTGPTSGSPICTNGGNITPKEADSILLVEFENLGPRPATTEFIDIEAETIPAKAKDRPQGMIPIIPRYNERTCGQDVEVSIRPSQAPSVEVERLYWKLHLSPKQIQDIGEGRRTLFLTGYLLVDAFKDQMQRSGICGAQFTDKANYPCTQAYWAREYEKGNQYPDVANFKLDAIPQECVTDLMPQNPN